MRDAVQWFVHLVRRDMELFEVDVGEKENLFNKILKRLKE